MSANDKADLVKWIESHGWTVDSDGAATVATDELGKSIRFGPGTKLGWNLRRIRAEINGGPRTRNRKKAVAATKRAEAEQLEAARAAALDKRDAQIAKEDARRRILARERELAEVARLMRPGA